MSSDAPSTSAGQKHQLRQAWSIWYLKRQLGTQPKAQEAYEKGITRLASFTTAEDFWGIYNHVVRPSDVPMPMDFHLFLESVKPMWEDPENANGGRFIVRVPRGKRISSRYWEDLMLAVIGGQFEAPDDEIAGIVISSRYQFDMLSVWTKHADNLDFRESIEADLKRVLKLPHHYRIEYKAHNDAKQESANPQPRPQQPPQQKSPQKRRGKGEKFGAGGAGGGAHDKEEKEEKKEKDEKDAANSEKHESLEGKADGVDEVAEEKEES